MIVLFVFIMLCLFFGVLYLIAKDNSTPKAADVKDLRMMMWIMWFMVIACVITNTDDFRFNIDKILSEDRGWILQAIKSDNERDRNMKAYVLDAEERLNNRIDILMQAEEQRVRGY